MKISKEVRVGLFMIASLVLLYFGFYYLKGIDFFSSNRKYYATFHNIDGLTESNQILLNGFAVGRVSDIQIQQRRNRVVVELSINSEIILTDSSIAVLNGDLLGSRFIQLIPGKGQRRLASRDTIRTDVAKGLTDLITENAEPVAANLQTTLTKLNDLLDSLKNTSRLANEAIVTFKAIPGTLDQKLTSVQQNIDTLTGTLLVTGNKLNTSLTALQPTLQNFRVLSDSLKRLQLNSTVKKTQEALARLNDTLEKLNSGDNTASKLLTDDSLYVNLNILLRNLDSLANNFNENPKHFLAPLGKSKKQIQRERERERKRNQ